jgi:hypothetical protein
LFGDLVTYDESPESVHQGGGMGLAGRLQGRFLGWLCAVFLFLLPVVAHARVDAPSISASVLGTGESGGAQMALTEYQVRQIMAAEPSAQPPLITALVRQINETRRRGKYPQETIPESLLQEWLQSLLLRKAEPQKWPERLIELATIYDTLQLRMSALVVRRVGIDDAVIRANAALVVGDLGTAATRLDDALVVAQADSTAAIAERRVAADQFLSSLLAARGLLKSLQGDAGSAKNFLLRASALLGVEDPERPTLLLLAGSAGAVAGARESMVEIAKVVLAQVDERPVPVASVAVWRRARWVAYLWIGIDSLNRLDTQATKDAFRLANEVAPLADNDEPSIWSGVWLGQYVLAALGEDDSTIDVLSHQREALRLSREMTRLRPDWATGWLARAQSNLIAAVDAIKDRNSGSAMPYLQDALTSLDRLTSQGHDSREALTFRLQVLILSQIERVVQGDAEQGRLLLAQASAVADELKKRKVDSSDPVYLAALYALKLAESEMHRQLDDHESVLKVLAEALSLAEQGAAERVGSDPWWSLERWRIHTLLADAAEGNNQLALAQHHRREAVLRAEREAGRAGSPVAWQERFWESLYTLSKTLGKQYLAEEALRVHERALSLARRHAASERTYGEWHHRVFLALMASTDFLRQRGGNVRLQYEEAARGPVDLFEVSEHSGIAAEDLWTVRTVVGKAHLANGDDDLAEQVLKEALGISERALRAEPSSDPWLDRSASSHTRLAEVAHARRAWLQEASHRQSAVAISAKRSATALNSSSKQKDHWYRLYDLAMVQQTLNLDRDALGSMTLARALAQRFAAQYPKDRIWQQYLWYANDKMGRMADLVRDAATAEAAFLAAASVAELMAGQEKDPRDWWERAAESLEALADAYLRQTNETEARRSSMRAGDFRSKINELDREAKIQEDVRRQVDGLLDVLALTADEARGLRKNALVARLQNAIDKTTDLIQKSGMNEMRSEQLRGLRNALFVVQQLPDM